jgi:hypothetical protein
MNGVFVIVDDDKKVDYFVLLYLSRIEVLKTGAYLLCCTSTIILSSSSVHGILLISGFR